MAANTHAGQLKRESDSDSEKAGERRQVEERERRETANIRQERDKFSFGSESPELEITLHSSRVRCCWRLAKQVFARLASADG